jgi:hypothetical protein
VWEAHREHYYQKLVRLGWGHRRTALAEYALMVAGGVLALVGLMLPEALQAVLLAGAAGAYLLIMVSIDRAWRAADGK